MFVPMNIETIKIKHKMKSEKYVCGFDHAKKE